MPFRTLDEKCAENRLQYEGRACKRCAAPLPAPDPPRFGLPRYCPACARPEGLRPVLAHVAGYHMPPGEFRVHCLEADGRTGVGPWITLRGLRAVVLFAYRGNVHVPGFWEDFSRHFKTYGHASFWMHLTPAQHAKLRRR